MGVHVQSRPTLCNPIGYSLPGYSVRGIFQARILGWVAISFSTETGRFVSAEATEGIYPQPLLPTVCGPLAFSGPSLNSEHLAP